MQIIPAIDIINGKCVRLTQGDYNSITVYNDNPLDVAKQFEDAGLKRLHLVDLDGARMGRVRNWKTLEQIATHTDLVTDFSGGIATPLQVNNAFNAGAWFVTLGSMAVRNEIMVSGWIKSFGPERFIISCDVKNEKVLIKGWTETTNMTVNDLIEKYKAKKVSQFMCTDVSRDGMLTGPSVNLYKKIISKQKTIRLTASGGVSSIKDIRALKEAGCSGVIIGKAIYEKKISLKQLTLFLNHKDSKAQSSTKKY